MATQLTLNDGSLNSAGSLLLKTNGTTTAVTIDTSQNMGLGATPSAWGSSWKALDISGGGAFAGAFNSAYMLGNVYYNASNGVYKATGPAGHYGIEAGTHVWKIAPSGTAGNAISFTQAMTLDASGNLGIGSTSPNIAGVNKAITLNTTNGTSGAIYEIAVSGTNYAYLFANATNTVLSSVQNLPLLFNTNNTERARIDSSGNLLVGTNSAGGYKFKVTNADSTDNTLLALFTLASGAGTHYFFNATGTGVNTGASAMWIQKNSTSSRSINAAGTINASGADYAEYMTKAGDFTVAKGDVVGINAEGKLTNVFADAVSFVVKSTDPSYVGGDVWGSEEALGLTKPTDESTQAEKDAFNAALEVARQAVDRIAFAGQVPVNVMGATAGQYIIPVNDNGAIKGEAVNETDMTLSQYIKAVGKVIAIESDGRAKIIVKVA